MGFLGRDRGGAAFAASPALRLAALALAGPASGAAAVGPEVPPSTGKTVTIKIAEVGGRLRFVGPATVAVGDELEVVNTTNPQQVGPFTFSLGRPGYLPKTRHAQAECFTPNHICWAIAEWQGTHGEGVPTVNPAEAGLPGWDTPGTTTSPGDSWFTGLKAGTHFAQEVTAKAGTRLWFMDAIHPSLRGTIKVVAP
jgi:hypothetical protein